MSTHFLPPGLSLPDPQQHEVYAWERDFVEPRVGPEIMSREECLDLVAAAAAHLGLPSTPTVTFPVIQMACKAIPSRNAIEIADWGRSRITVLHEMAHFGSWRKVVQGEAPHGESFLGCAIGLYAKFCGLDLNWLEQTATLRRLRFIPNIEPTIGRIADFFPGEI